MMKYLVASIKSFKTDGFHILTCSMKICLFYGENIHKQSQPLILLRDSLEVQAAEESKSCESFNYGLCR